MKTTILIFTIFNLLFFSGCDDDGDDTPTMSTCILYGNDPVACEEAGCTVMGGGRAVYRDGRCVAFVPFACFPRKDDECASVESSYCSFQSDVVDVVYSGNTCSQNLGSGWEKCPSGYGVASMECYPDATVCESITSLESCHGEYCTWVRDARRAVMNEGTCTGWEVTTVSFCASYVPNYATILHRETQDGTELLLLGEVLPPPDVEQNKMNSTPDPWSFCSGSTGLDDPICASCPEPTK